MKAAVILALGLSLIGTDLLAKGFYKWVDDSGQVHYSDTPPSTRATNPESETRDIAISPLYRRDGGVEFCGPVRLASDEEPPQVVLARVSERLPQWQQRMSELRATRVEAIQQKTVKQFRGAAAQAEARRVEQITRELANTRCQVRWAHQKLRHLAEVRDYIMRRQDDLKAAIEQLQRQILVNCGAEPKTEAERETFLDRWRACTSPYLAELQRREQALEVVRGRYEAIE